MILVIGAGGMVGSALVRRLRDRGEAVGEVYSPWSGVMERNDRWVADVTKIEDLHRLAILPCPFTTIYYCASRAPHGKTAEEKFFGRVNGVAAVVTMFPGVPIVYCSSTRAGQHRDVYAYAQHRCEAIVTSYGGTFVRFPALYSSSYRSWLRWVKWIYPAWSVEQAVTALLEV